MNETTREQHIAWCKKRAMEYVECGDLAQAFASMMSDLNKHSETRDHTAIRLGLMLRMGGHLNAPDEMRRFIDGFN